jgi:Flp pilus assembly pilin Flp
MNDMKHLLNKCIREEDGQGLVEYTLIVLLVALVFWVAVKGTNVDEALKTGWGKIVTCVTNPLGNCS